MPGGGVAAGRFDLEQGVGEVADMLGVHRLCVEVGSFGFEGLDVAPAQLEGVACFLDGGACPAGMADGETGFG